MVKTAYQNPLIKQAAKDLLKNNYLPKLELHLDVANMHQVNQLC